MVTGGYATVRIGTAPAAEVVPPGDEDLETLLLIRHFEEALLRLFEQGKLTGTTHTCLGQEIVPVALTPLLSPVWVFSNHRGHGHYLAQFHDPAGLLAELTGRAGSVCGGMGGSQHLYRDGFCSTGVQGEGVSAALGFAMRLRRTGRPGLAVAYIGDGTLGEGVVYESLNMAQLWQAPLVIVIEHNGIAQTTPTNQALAGTVAGRAAAFGVRHVEVGGIDLDGIRARLEESVDRVRGGGGPLVIEFRTARLGPHSKGDDTRGPAELARLREADWYPRFAAADPDRFRLHDHRQRRLIDETVREVLSRPLADGEAS